MTAKALLLAASLLAVSASVSTAQVAPAVTPAPGASSPVENAAGARLRQLFHDSDEANLRRNPLSALFRGDFRYADRLGDYMSDAYYTAEREAAPTPPPAPPPATTAPKPAPAAPAARPRRPTEPRIFVPPRAPDDPGTDASDLDDLSGYPTKA